MIFLFMLDSVMFLAVWSNPRVTEEHAFGDGFCSSIFQLWWIFPVVDHYVGSHKHISS